MIFNVANKDRTSVEVEAMITNLKNEIDTMLADVKTTITNSLGVVKSVQRGVTKLTNNASTNVTININSVDPDKCMVIINSDKVIDGYTSYLSILTSLTETELTLSFAGAPNVSGGSISWQVIEFY